MVGKAKKVVSSRKLLQTEKPLIGQPADLSGRVLPTGEDVLRYYAWTRIKLLEETSVPGTSKIAEQVAERVEEIWTTASIPTIATKSIATKVSRLQKRFEDVIKSSKSEKNAPSYTRNANNLKRDFLSKLFDVCCCQCPLTGLCVCPLKNKVPILERPFLEDQRKDRKMAIGNVDVQETTKLQNRLERRSRVDYLKKNMEFQMFHQVARNSESESGSEAVSNVSVSGSTSGSDYELTNKGTKRVKKPNTGTVTVQKKLPRTLNNYARVLDRRGVSSRAGAEIASALFQDLGVVTNDDLSAVIDKSKVQRERSKTRHRIVSATRISDFIGLYFDGRKDLTFAIETIEGVTHRKPVKEEHISMVEEPGSQYMAHVTPEDGTARSIKNAMLEYLQRNQISTQAFRVIGCDSTAVNTGRFNGVVHLVEKELQRALQVVICLLHLNELPLRKLMAVLDGETSGPKAFKEPIGKAILNCEKRPVVSFERIATAFDFQGDEVTGLSTDQQYLWDICSAVFTGVCPSSLANRLPGNVSHARWLTPGNRVLRLYISTQNPSSNLRKLTEFIMKVYAPSWFSIKRDSLVTQAPENFHKIVRRCDYLEENLKKEVHLVLERNAYAAHSEMLLLAMVFDPRESVRRFAVKEIEEARNNVPAKTRSFSPPKVDLAAEDYTDLIDWETVPVTPPPLLSDFSIEDLNALIKDTPDRNRRPFNVPSHTQAVERIVKEVTEAAKNVCGEEKRDGFIRSRLLSRQILPKFDHKGQFLALENNEIE